MPTYEYRCPRCTFIKTYIMSIKYHETAVLYCPKCDAKLFPVISAPGIVNRANLRIPKAGSHLRTRT